MQEPKEVLKGRGLKVAFNSLKIAHKNAMVIGDHYLGTRNIVEVIEPCVKNHAENPNFPADDVRENVNGLRMAVEKRKVHEVHYYREQIEQLLSPWVEVPTPIMVGS